MFKGGWKETVQGLKEAGKKLCKVSRRLEKMVQMFRGGWEEMVQGLEEAGKVELEILRCIDV
jgi:hypothetical protein